jgi:hypothetical protein
MTTHPNTPGYALLQELRRRFYGIELHVECDQPCEYLLVVDGEFYRDHVWDPDERLKDLAAAWRSRIAEMCTRLTIARIERIKATYATETTIPLPF